MWAGSDGSPAQKTWDSKSPCNAALGTFREKKFWFLGNVWSKWLKQKMFQNKLQIPNTLQISNRLLMQMESFASQSSFNLDGPEVECMADFLCGLRYVSALHDHKKLTDSAYMESFVQISVFTKKFKGPLFVGSKKLACFSETIAAAVMSSPHWKEMVDSIEAVDQALLEGQKRVKDAEDELTANALDLSVRGLH